MTAHLRLLRNPLVALAPPDDGYLAYDTVGNRLHRLNAAAALILELCDGSRTVATVVSELAQVVADETNAACARWIARAVEDDLLKTFAPGMPDPEAPPADYFASLASRLRSDGHVLAAFVCQHHATLQKTNAAEQWAALAELAHIIGRRDDAREAYEEYLPLATGDAEVGHIPVLLR